MASDYMPRNDAEFMVWLDQFMSYLTAHVENVGLSEAEIADLLADLPLFQTALLEFQDARIAYKAKRDTKTDSRTAIQEIIRPLVSRIQSYAGTTNADRQALGIPVRNGETTPQEITIANNKPQAIVDVSQRYKHVLRIRNETQGSSFRAKPKGAKYAEVWIKKGGSAEDLTGYVFYGTASKSPYLVEFNPEDANLPVHYRLCWVDGKGNKSTWSEIETATVAA